MKKLIFAATALLMIASSACKKDKNPDLPNNPAKPKIKTVFDQNRNAAKQTFTINAGVDNTITGAKGTKVTIYSNALRTPSGGIVTGNVTIELIESPTISDMVWLNAQTVGNDNGTMRALVSGGQIWLNATQSGQTLSLVSGGSSFVQIPAQNIDPNMDLFFGTTDSTGNVTWVPADSSGVWGGQDSTGGLFYNFANDSMGWINLDYFSGQGGMQTVIQATAPGAYDNSNTTVWLVIPSMNSVANIWSYATGVFSSGNYTIPVGTQVKFVALHFDGTNYFSHFGNLTSIVNGHNETLSFTATTLAQFQLDCAGL